MGQGGYLQAELDGAGPFSPIKIHTVPLELFILKVLKKEAETMKARLGPTGSIKTMTLNSEVRNNLCALVNQ